MNFVILTNKVSEPPTMLRPSPILSLLISTVVSLPGVISQVVGSAGCSSGVVGWCLAEGDGDNRRVAEGEALGKMGVVAREDGFVAVPELDTTEGDIVWMEFCGFSDEIVGFGCNPERVVY
jgi:hypothetical protein